MEEHLADKPLHTMALYSEQCVEYLTQALKKAESEVKDDFRRYYETPESDVHHWSSDEEGGGEEGRSSDEESETEQEGPGAETPSVSASQPTTTQQNQQAKPKPPKKLSLNEKQKESVIRQMGKPPCARLPLPEPDNLVVEIPNALLSKEERLSSMSVQCESYLRIATGLANEKKPALVLLLRSGRFAGAIFNGPKCLHHTTSTRYTIRKGQGKAQSAQDGRRKPKSVGSQLRRAGEEALRQDVKSFLQCHKAHVKSAGLILMSCPKVMMKTFFEDNDDTIPRGDNRLRKIPLDVGRPTFEAVVGVYEIMTKVSIMVKPQVEDKVPCEAPARVIEQLQTVPEVVEKLKEIIPLTRLHVLAAAANLSDIIRFLDTESDFDIDQQAGEDFMTPLHVAADSANHLDPTASAGCVTALLVQGKANPVVLDARRRAPYFLASHDKVRDAFRMARATLGEDYCNWDNAKVGPPLTLENLQEKKDKAAEKKRRQRARQKENKARESSEAKEMEKKRQDEEERQKQEEDAKRIRDGLQVKTTTATNVCDFCQKRSKGKRRSQMFLRLDYAYCSTECVQNHKRELMAAAALARFG